MAQSKSFFGLRRGSTKSHTYQVYRGVQVTKDRVYDVANPQSEAQMKQRLLLPMVANAASILKGIVNHSFEGIEYGDKSVRYFRQINLKGGALDVISYVPKGMMNCGVNDFQVSKGTLGPVGMDGLNNVLSDGKTKLNIKADIPTGATVKLTGVTDGSQLTQDQLKAIEPIFCGNNAYDQVTFIISYPGNDYQWTGSDGNTKTEPYNRFYISRLVFDGERFSENKDWKWNVSDQATYLHNGYMKIDLSGILSESGLIPGDEISIENDTDYNISTSTILMAACITSKLEGSTWRRSNSYFIHVDAEDVTYNDVVNTYLNAAEGAASTKYLNAGNTSVDIPGGDTLVSGSTVLTKGA